MTKQDSLLAYGRDPENTQRVEIKMRREDGLEISCVFDPETTMDLCEAIARQAYECKYGRPPTSVVTLRDEVLNRKRAMLITRGVLIVPQLLEQKRSNSYIVETLIDMVLKEVT